jgi:RNA polymerase sigma-70 factor, ECF subfamily
MSYTGRVPNEAERLLVARCLRGEAAAWDELFTAQYSATARFIFQISGDFSREDAEEIAQETFLSVVQHLGGFQGGSQLQTWIFRIAGNKARDFLEKRNAAKRGGGQLALSLDAEDPETGLSPDPASPLPAPDLILQNTETASLMTDALALMEAPCREVIELRYFGDRSYEEISAELGLNVKTVSSRLSKCLDRLEGIARRLFSRKNSPPHPV